MTTNIDVLLAAQKLAAEINLQLAREGNTAMVSLLALRALERTMTASMRKNQNLTSVTNQLWGELMPMLDSSIAKLGMATGAD